MDYLAFQTLCGYLLEGNHIENKTSFCPSHASVQGAHFKARTFARYISLQLSILIDASSSHILVSSTAQPLPSFTMLANNPYNKDKPDQRKASGHGGRKSGHGGARTVTSLESE